MLLTNRCSARRRSLCCCRSQQICPDETQHRWESILFLMSADAIASRKTRRKLTEVAAHGEVRDAGNEVDQRGDVVEDAVARVPDVCPDEQSSKTHSGHDGEVEVAAMSGDVFVDGLTIGGEAVRGESIVASCSQSYEHHESEEFGQHDGLFDGSDADACIELLQL